MSQRNDALIADVRRAMKLLNLRKSEVAEQLQMGTTKGQIKRCHAKPQSISFLAVLSFWHRCNRLAESFPTHPGLPKSANMKLSGGARE